MPFTLAPVDWIAAGIVIAFLIPIIVVDLYRFLIPDILVYPGIIALLVYLALADSHIFIPALVHGALGFSIIIIFWFLSKKQIGLGDAKLSFFMAAGLGFFEWWAILLVASVSAAIVGLMRIKAGKMTMKDKLPLAPFFGIGTICVLALKCAFWNTIVSWFAR